VADLGLLPRHLPSRWHYAAFQSAKLGLNGKWESRIELIFLIFKGMNEIIEAEIE
jgi:hypothetical protein